MTTYRTGNRELGVDKGAPVSASLSTESAEQASGVPASTPSRSDAQCPDEWQSQHRFGSRPNMCATCSETSGKLADLCTCTKTGPDPACVVHQGRRVRGPKPAPIGPGCICDGSGRTCPRHGAVI